MPVENSVISNKPVIYSLLSLFVIGSDALAKDRGLEIPEFSLNNSPQISSLWQPYSFDGIAHTEYKLVTVANDYVLQANSQNSASGLIHNIRFNPYDYPYISWRWKINKPLNVSNAQDKKSDDYALRLYINFDYDIDDLPFSEQFSARLYQKIKGKSAPLASLNYIWEKKLTKESIIPSPYTERVQMLVLQNQNSSSDEWNYEQRNIVEDYIRAFGEPPKDVISIAIMTDSDNTQGNSQAYYGDIKLSRKAVKDD